MLADATPRTSEASISLRHVGAYASNSHRIRYLAIVSVLVVAALAVTILMFMWGNDYEPFSRRWWRITTMRSNALAVLALVTFCQAFATVTFQTVTNNRIITPSIMGFESLYVLVQTAIVFFFGMSGLVSIPAFARFLLQTALMVLFAVLL